MYSAKRRFRLFRDPAFTGGGPLIEFATGGTVVPGATTYHVFESAGTFTVTTIPADSTINYLVVGGGGGGGDRHGGGGGAGGVLAGSFTPGIQSYAVTVGAGGAGGNHELLTPGGGNGGLGLRGGDSSIATVATAFGGGGGGTFEVVNPPGTFGSGGGGGGQNRTGSVGTPGQGNAGGNGLNPGGGGGGGAGAAGTNANVSTGGIGTTAYSSHLLAVGYGTTFATTPNNPVSGGVAYIGGGGGGGAESTTVPFIRLGGLGGGGTGTYGATGHTVGTPNTGGGGGATRGDPGAGTAGQIGGSGVVILWYSTTAPAPSPAPAAAFTPLSISGADVWFDAKDPATITLSGTDVTSWSNKGALSTAAVKGGTSAPVYDAATNSMTFSKVTGDAFFTAPYTGTNFDNDITIFIMHSLLAQTSTMDGNMSLCGVFTSGNASSGYIFSYTLSFTTPSADDIRFFRANSVNIRLPFTKPPVDQLKLLVGGKNGTNYAVHDDGSLWQSATGTGVALSPSANTIRLAASGPGRNLHGKIYEVLIYNRALTVTERQTVEGYLCHRWGRASALPSGHPYKTSAP